MLLVLQVPSVQFKQLSGMVLRRLEELKLLVIVDDVPPEDFACFQAGSPDLLSLQNGSRCIITSRSVGLAVADLTAQCVTLTPHEVRYQLSPSY